MAMDFTREQLPRKTSDSQNVHKHPTLHSSIVISFPGMVRGTGNVCHFYRSFLPFLPQIPNKIRFFIPIPIVRVIVRFSKIIFFFFF